MYKKFVAFSMRFKPVFALYSVTFLWYLLFADLLVWKKGTLSTAVLWQVTLLSLLLALTQIWLMYANWPASLGVKGRLVLHLLLDYAILLAGFWGFGWLPAVTPLTLALFTGGFLLLYWALFWGWGVYYGNLTLQLNNRLAEYKKH